MLIAMRLSTVSFLAASFPVLTIHLSFLWAASNGHIGWCFPYGFDCVSISSTGRQLPESVLFKAGMLPAAGLLMLYWWQTRAQLRKRIGSTLSGHWMLALGLIAACGLVIYVMALGQIGELYHLQRRIGVTLFYGLSYLALLMLIVQLGSLKDDAVIYAWRPRLVALAGLLLGLGLLNVVISAMDKAFYHRVDDAFEWGLTLLLCLLVAVSGLMWRRLGD